MMMNAKTKSLLQVLVIIVAIFAVIVTSPDSISKHASAYDDHDPHPMSIDGIAPTHENIIDKTYPIQRNLVLCTNGEPDGDVKAFIDWVISEEGQYIVSKEFIPLTDKDVIHEEPSDGAVIRVGGSTSIQQTMMLLAERYMSKYPSVTVTVQGGGSGAGASGTINGTLDIGMCSRDLKQSEMDKGLVPTIIGIDAVVVVANGIGIENISLEDLAKVFNGEIEKWSEIGGVERNIGVISREEGSGTRECFDNLMSNTMEGWHLKEYCVVFNNTGGVINMVNFALGSIGYISVGQLRNL